MEVVMVVVIEFVIVFVIVVVIVMVIVLVIVLCCKPRPLPTVGCENACKPRPLPTFARDFDGANTRNWLVYLVFWQALAIWAVWSLATMVSTFQ